MQGEEIQCRHIEISRLTPDISKRAVVDMLQSTVGPVQSVRIVNGVASVAFQKMDAWEAVWKCEFVHGEQSRVRIIGSG